MTDPNTKEAWDRFQADVKSMAGELRRHYEGVDDEKKAAEVHRSLQQLGEAAEAFFESLDQTTRDPQVRASTKRAAKSFGSALAGTLREVSDELERAFKKAATSK
jgi:hypothetical protein